MLKCDTNSAIIMPTSRGWILCPYCNGSKRLQRIKPETRATDLPVYCRNCKREYIVNIDGQSVYRQSFNHHEG